MSHIYHTVGSEYTYFDRRNYSRDTWVDKISKSTTIYIGNLSVFTTEEIINEIFSSCGPIKAIYMGLNHQTMQPCGFCFVQYYRHADALTAISTLDRSLCDGRIMRVDWDSGEDISGSRRYWRGNTGLQWLDESRNQENPGQGLYRNAVRPWHKFPPRNRGNGHKGRHRGVRWRGNSCLLGNKYISRDYIKNKCQQSESQKTVNGPQIVYPDY
ncbi:RRM domain-containing protein [Cryptosporidium canis]|uniref:Nuclear cap-binding protein subunit 2 n=1 Tax=Cryptosporidium canis TaxID=195482 RepID=A0A9D5DIU2_9CRYT|nr:RRM domain-containing protein [Cryptosporidium canis]